jgi:hypothetical protein
LPDLSAGKRISSAKKHHSSTFSDTVFENDNLQFHLMIFHISAVLKDFWVSIF